jgi:nicotinamidase-related amidase
VTDSRIVRRMTCGLVIVDIQNDYFPGGANPLEGPELEFGGRTIPAGDVHAAFLAALADSYAELADAGSLADGQ